MFVHINICMSYSAVHFQNNFQMHKSIPHKSCLWAGILWSHKNIFFWKKSIYNQCLSLEERWKYCALYNRSLLLMISTQIVLKQKSTPSCPKIVLSSLEWNRAILALKKCGINKKKKSIYFILIFFSSLVTFIDDHMKRSKINYTTVIPMLMLCLYYD